MEENKNKKKIIIGIILIVVIVALAAIGISMNNNNNNKEENTNKESSKKQNEITVKEKEIPNHLLEEKKFEKIKLKDIYMHAVEGSTIFRAKAENISDELLKNRTLTIIFNGNNGEECDRVVYPLELVRTGESIEIDYLLTVDISNIKDVSVEVGEEKEVDE